MGLRDRLKKIGQKVEAKREAGRVKKVAKLTAKAEKAEEHYSKEQEVHAARSRLADVQAKRQAIRPPSRLQQAAQAVKKYQAKSAPRRRAAPKRKAKAKRRVTPRPIRQRVAPRKPQRRQTRSKKYSLNIPL